MADVPKELRDQIAIAAMHSMIEMTAPILRGHCRMNPFSDHGPGECKNMRLIAEWSYNMADVMIEYGYPE